MSDWKDTLNLPAPTSDEGNLPTTSPKRSPVGISGLVRNAHCPRGGTKFVLPTDAVRECQLHMARRQQDSEGHRQVALDER